MAPVSGCINDSSRNKSDKTGIKTGSDGTSQEMLTRDIVHDMHESTVISLMH